MPALLITPCARTQRYLKNVLESLGRRIILAPNRGEALCRMRKEDVDLLICDCELPDGNWKDVLGDIRSREPAPPLIVISNLADERLWTEVLTSGGYDVVPKPFDGPEIVRVINLAWHDAARHRRRPGARIAAA